MGIGVTMGILPAKSARGQCKFLMSGAEQGKDMESKTAQNVQDTYFNTVRNDKTPLTIYLVNGVRVHGRIRSFDKFSVLLENGEQEQLVFKHAISTVTTTAASARTDKRVPMAVFKAMPTAGTHSPMSAVAEGGSDVNGPTATARQAGK